MLRDSQYLWNCLAVWETEAQKEKWLRLPSQIMMPLEKPGACTPPQKRSAVQLVPVPEAQLSVRDSRVSVRGWYCEGLVLAKNKVLD